MIVFVTENFINYLVFKLLIAISNQITNECEYFTLLDDELYEQIKISSSPLLRLFNGEFQSNKSLRKCFSIKSLDLPDEIIQLYEWPERNKFVQVFHSKRNMAVSTDILHFRKFH